MIQRTGTLKLVARDAKPRPPLEPFRSPPAARPTKDGAELRGITPNAGVAAWYREQLQDLTRRMARDALRKLRRHYRPALSRLALDDDPIVTLRRVMSVWGRLWQKRFDDMSKDIAALFADRSQRHLDSAFRKRLKDAGFTVSFRPTERQVSAYRAVVAENVNLIRSIPREFLKDVQGTVWRSVMTGGTMGELSTSIRKKYGISYRRASFIASDQTNKAKAVMEQARRGELGIREATWKHSHAGRQPRPAHVKMDGKRFDVAKGMWDPHEQQWIQPGELPRCRCTSRSIIPARLAKSQ
jgi:SPP1 gp7 family putative phage head morphogenesis protein